MGIIGMILEGGARGGGREIIKERGNGKLDVKSKSSMRK